MAATTNVAELARRTAEHLSASQVGVVVAAIRVDEITIHSAGRTGRPDGGVPGAATLFEIGSVTKVFTALALARMAVAGTVGLDEPVRDLLPEGTAVPNRDGEQVTLRQLAAHTSGLPRLPMPLWRVVLLPTPPDPYARFTAEVVLERLAQTRLHAAPGKRFRYSNFGAGLLGLALAHRAGTDFEALIAEQVCQPIGMSNTFITVPEAASQRFAQGHSRRRRPRQPWHLAALAGAGGLRSTATDVAAFLRAQLIAADGGGADGMGEAMRLSHQVQHPINQSASACLGWVSGRIPDGSGFAEYRWHNGGTGGFRSWAGFVPGRGVAVAVFGNTDRSVDGPALDLLRTLACGADPAPPSGGPRS